MLPLIIAFGYKSVSNVAVDGAISSSGGSMSSASKGAELGTKRSFKDFEDAGYHSEDHVGISNAAPADAPLFPISLPKVVEGRIVEDNCKETEGQIHDYINNLCFRISPMDFFQVNTLACERLYSLAGDWAGLSHETLIFDVCCRTGTIGLTLANRAGMVVGLKWLPLPLQMPKEMQKLKAEDVMDSLLKEYLDLPAETESDIKGDVSDKNNDTITKECSYHKFKGCFYIKLNKCFLLKILSST